MTEPFKVLGVEDDGTFRYFGCAQCGSPLVGPNPQPGPTAGGEAVIDAIHGKGAATDGVKWTTWDCPVHGPVVWSADKGSLDIGIVRKDGIDLEAAAARFEEHLEGP